MKRTYLLPLTTALVALACRDGAMAPAGSLGSIRADRFDNAEWSEPVNLGPIVNSSATDQNAFLTRDQHDMYFGSNRAGALGGSQDIYVAHRKCIKCDWETPVNLGPPVNTTGVEGSATLSDDGQLLFFYSNRPGSQGRDIWVSHRVATDDGDVWGDPVNLGPYVNTAADEQAAYYVNGDGGHATLYFNRILGAGDQDIYSVPLSSNGEPLAPAVAVPGINTTVLDQKVAVRTDGHELLLSSNRPGGFGDLDMWRFTRQDIHDDWSPAEHVGAPLNTSFLDAQPALSEDGKTVIFTSNRPGGSGGNDLWMATRRPGAQ